jgi:hypothetical protein
MASLTSTSIFILSMTCKNEINYKDPISPVFQSQLLISEIFLERYFAWFLYSLLLVGVKRWRIKGNKATE